MALSVFVAALLSVLTASGVCVPVGFKPFDCSELYNAGQTLSGIYYIYPAGSIPIWAYCQMVSNGTDEDNGGWTVIQRRMDGHVNFFRPWREYKKGFGVTRGEYWLGLVNMYQLTRNRKYMLRVDLEDFDGRKGFALYSSFSVGSETDGYKLQVSGFRDGGAGDSLSYHSGQKFSTFDKDQDSFVGNCASINVGGFWYKSCFHTNPNGLYLWGKGRTDTISSNAWFSWRRDYTGLKSVMMKIKLV